MPHASRPGDVLAERYRLNVLLTESGQGRFWRAHDTILGRDVALHVIAADDPRAPGLMEAARRSATVLDPRLLRVLDADRDDEGLCYVVNEWGDGTSLDIVVAGNGPLGPRRAAWLVAETAGAVATAHRAGVTHGRLVPENVLIDRSGGIRVIGLNVDAALHGLTAQRPDVDLADLAGLLYAALTTTWAGRSTSIVPDAPREHGEVIRPRRVRAGVPRSLDVLCEEVLHPNDVVGTRSRTHADLRTARGIAAYLEEFVGDPTGMREAMVASTPDVLPEEGLVVLPQVPEMTVRDAARLAEPPPPLEPRAEPDADSSQQPDPPSPAPPAGAPEELPTEAGLPIFGEGVDDVSWWQRRTEPAPPPPPFDDLPERPLFAPTPPDGAPVRRPRPGAGGPAADSGYWPWGPEPEITEAATETPGRLRTAHRRLTTSSTLLPIVDEEVPGRSFLRIAGGLVVALLLLVAVIVAVNLYRGRTALGGSTDPSTPSPSQSSPTDQVTADPVLRGTTARFFDPLGDDSENGEQAKLAVDGKPGTFWPTQTYRQNLGPGGLKSGVGLVIDLGATREISATDITFVGAPTAASIYVTDRAPDTVSGLTAAAAGRTRGVDTDLDLDLDATGRYVTVWLTSLPQLAPEQFRAEIAEIAIRGH